MQKLLKRIFNNYLTDFPFPSAERTNNNAVVGAENHASVDTK